jgi:hypothetical protein
VILITAAPPFKSDFINSHSRLDAKNGKACRKTKKSWKNAPTPNGLQMASILLWNAKKLVKIINYIIA